MKGLSSRVKAFFIGCMMICCGCSTYYIDSNPQGLRVTINNLEQGVTPLKYTWAHGGEYGSLHICVTQPSRAQIRDYEQKNNRIVSIWQNGEMTKTMWSKDGGGNVFFQFITNEYDQPKTDEEAEWVKASMAKDAEFIKERREMILKIEDEK